jgi:hypothetical protein
VKGTAKEQDQFVEQLVSDIQNAKKKNFKRVGPLVC